MIPRQTVLEERTVVIQASDQEVQTGVTIDQQCLQTAVYREIHQMYTRSVWLSRQINVGESSQSWKLHWMATAHNIKCQEVLLSNRQDAQGSHDSIQKKFALCQGEAYIPQDMQHRQAAWQKVEGHIHQVI